MLADESTMTVVPEEGDGSPAPTWSPRRILQSLVLAAPVAWILLLGWTHRWMTEDGFIYLRIVRQIRVGNGPVFNAGERVEAFTGTLWVGILSLADLILPFRLEWIAVVLGLLCTAGGVTLAVIGARRLHAAEGADRFVVPVGAAVFVVVFPTWVYATSGLETGLVFAWLGACVWILARWSSDDARSVGVSGAVVLGLGWLVRPEMVIFSAAFLVLVVAFERPRGRWRLPWRVVAAAVALPVAYQIFRMGYFASLVANTAIAKEGSSTNVTRGWRYFTDFAGPYWLWVPVLGLLLGGYLPLVATSWDHRQWRRGGVAAAFIAGAAINTLYVIGVGGDYHHGRLLLPALFALCAPVAAIPVTRRHVAAVAIAVWAPIAALTLRPVQYDGNPFAHGILVPLHFGDVTASDIGWGPGGPYLRWYTGPAYYHEAGLLQYVRTDVKVRPGVPLPYVALWGVGVSGYALGPDAHVLDQMGLADSLAAHMEGRPSLIPELARFPGHEKPLPAPWVAALVTPDDARPNPRDFPSFADPLIPSTTGQAFQSEVAWARAALRCGPIAGLRRSADAPLTLGRFAHNVADSFANTRLRIPPEPEAAYRRFCGTGTPPEVRALRPPP